MNQKNDLVKKALALGISSYQNSNFPQAKALFQKVLQLDDSNFYALHFFGIILLQEQNYKIAQLLLAKALGLKPKDAEVNHHLGLAFKGLGDANKASQCFIKAVKLQPSLAVAHLGYADALSELGRYKDAIAAYKTALKHDSTLIKAHNNLGSVYRKRSELLKAIPCYQAAYDLDPSRLDIFSNILMCMASEPSVSSEEYLIKAQVYGKAARAKAEPYTEWPLLEKIDKPKIRVGLVSGDLRKHSVAYFLKSWIDKLDNSKVELLAYSNYSDEDEVTEELKPCFTKWSKIAHRSDSDIAQTIYDDRVNILIDLSGHTAHNRLPLFAWKAAPIQISWMGFFASTGVAEIDYFIGDQWNFPDSIKPFYVEAPWHLNISGCFFPPDTDVSVGDLPALKNGYITFGCLHKITKLNDDVVALWSTILNENVSARLLIKDTAFCDAATTRSIKDRFALLGVDPERIDCEMGEARELYFDTYKRIDIGLDPFPFNGGTVNLESLWMGVPYISLLGSDRISRRGAAVLYKAGLDQFVAENEGEYIEIANKVCADIHALSEVRKGLREQVSESRLYNGSLMAQDLESAFSDMWFRYIEKV
ncbi:tetratricopeptide repeat protein [Neptuniibacter sp. 1_MG-2023]|uniref:O-linked N-acetylglucosamine transferase, SPINDLY family protein n=1 Tax=Neptuniibacter sp. 1_MG-2023 TaxID=3062662 RepID=UPI0026E17F5F|nr:tetratricopeptide repeat protein [Neptuniibacter sp. 1_MG-2023]MDO6594768.1 tetratricopeptide repeat protein [Neptuniibacter sp. 1_MG-2023]